MLDNEQNYDIIQVLRATKERKKKKLTKSSIFLTSKV